MTHLLEDDNGNPLGLVDMAQISDVATELAFAMAAFCDDTNHMQGITTQTLERVGSDAFGFVCASALRILAEHVLHPALTAGEAAGVYLRGGLIAIAEGRDPQVGEDR